MRQKHNTLLAGVAALALLAGGGIAAAQQSPQSQTKPDASMSAQGAQGATQAPSGKQGGAAAGMEQHAQTSSPSGSAASPAAKTSQPSMAQQGTDTAKPGNKPENRSAQTGQNNSANAKQSAQSNESKQRLGENAKQNTKENTKQTAKTENKSGERIGANEKSGHERMGANTRSERQHSRISERSERSHARMSERSQRKNEVKGLQGNASIPMQGSHVNLTSEQRTRIHDSVIDGRGAPRVGHVDFDLTVGTLVPRDRVHVVRVPETLVRIDPQWHGYLYFIVEDQVVIVNPRDMRIVAVLDV